VTPLDRDAPSGAPLRLAYDRRLHDAEVFRIEQEILQVVEERQQAMVKEYRDMLDTAEQLVAERLAPVDPHAAQVLLAEIRRGDLP